MNEKDLKSIFAPFADPETNIRMVQSEDYITFEIIRNGAELRYFYYKDTGKVIARHDQPKTYIGIDSLLASSEFANIRMMATNQKHMLSSLGGEPFLQPNLIIKPSINEGNDYDAFSDSLSSFAGGRVQICLIDGPAGIGKTRLLECLTYQRSRAYLNGSDLPPILYVTSRGRRLSNLYDALASATQIIRANFTFDQVPILVQRGLINIAIDGFDELVDADGYKDAWFALRDFLDELGSGGLCLLAGRDTFFEQQDFFDRLALSSEKFHLIQVHLSPISPGEAKVWLENNGWDNSEINSEYTDYVLEPESYTLRPYFLSILAGTKNGWQDVIKSGSPRNFLISQFLKREASILCEMVDISEKSALGGLNKMFEEIAIDMKERESNEVDVEYIDFACQITFQDLIDAKEVRKLSHKAGSFGLLERGINKNLRVFPHTEISYHFLANAIIRDIIKNSIPMLIRRSLLGNDFLEVFQDVFDIKNTEEATAVITNMQRTLSMEKTADRMGENLGAMLLTSLSREIRGLTRNLSFISTSEAIITGVATAAKLTDIYVGRLDVRGADLTKLEFDSCEVSILVVDSATKFGSHWPNVSILHVDDEVEEVTKRSPEEIHEWIRKHSGTTSETTYYDDLPLVRYFDQVCRRTMRNFYLRANVDHPASDVLENPYWEEIKEILEDEGRLKVSQRAPSGPPTPLIHIKNPKALLNPSAVDDPESFRIRKRIIDRAKALDI